MTKNKLRFVLLVVVPLILVVAGGIIYINSGRYVETDDAYVKADKTNIGAEVSGRVIEVAVKENQHVKKGDLLFSVDPKPYQLAVDQAQSNLSSIAINLKTMQAQYASKQASIAQAQSEVDYNSREESRERQLSTQGYVSSSTLDSTHQKTVIATLAINILEKQLNEIVDSFGGDIHAPIEQHPLYKQAQAQLGIAQNNLAHVNEYAPASGTVAQVITAGEYVQNGAITMLLVSDQDLYVEANFTEKDLTNIRLNQPATIKVDYAPGVTWHGKVLSISPATGSEYSVIPAQNATGNWVKITQRVPVRISVDTTPDMPQLRGGLSATISVDTKSATH